ncbi:LysR family transcriptional regulator [Shimia sp. R9_1]|uniref:LysR family transcriptional regulator n=1 Tax=Shimia sp. R9_1 TaxID=2821111 RepID=UPI001AD9BCC2|nr:LysR family transcriptional regulator [Shimia sp. R9_1]MBO9409672.1 LysR family transcriptional regulator [Shimia sp. R9_1]
MSVAPKRPKGPPLNAMRAFEAAARHVSFVAAAEELNVTPGAISQHIKTLEGWAGTPLFQRNAQGVALTAEGQALVADFTAAFDQLADAARALRNLTPNPDFHIAALPAVAQLWLPKRLRQVRAQFPEITFSVTAMETPPSLAREMFDLSIFFGVPDGAADQVAVCADAILPVCAPTLLPEAKEDLTAVTHLHDQTWEEDWALWAAHSGAEVSQSKGGPRFSLYSLAMEEAKAGAGVLMGHLCLIEEALASGALVAVEETPCPTGRSLLIAQPHPARRRAETAEIVAVLSG